MTIYKVSRGNAWDEYDIAYLTEDKLEKISQCCLQ